MTAPNRTTGKHRTAVVIYWILVAFGAGFLALNLVAMITAPDIGVIALASGAVQGLLLFGFALLLLPRNRLSVGPKWSAVVLGGTFCIGASSLINTESSTVVAPFLEEFVKLAAVALVLGIYFARLRGPLDGFIIGFFVGFGFELVEDVLYTFSAGSQSGVAADAWVQALWRTFLGFGMHNMFTAVAGAGLAYALLKARRAWAVATAALALAIVLHLLWDISGDLGLEPVGAVITKVVVYLALVAAVVWIRIKGSRFDRTPTTGEPVAGLVELT
jgi:RsiW-degrading membrane proteinase PrsW (M82 family)